MVKSLWLSNSHGREFTCKLATGSALANGEVRWRDRRYQKVYDISAISFDG